MRILLTAMKCLQNTQDTHKLYRGVNCDVVGMATNKNMYDCGNNFVWWSFSSTTTNVESVKHFLGGEGMQTIFHITSSKGANVSDFSVFGSDEGEFLLAPGTVLKSKGVMKSGNVTIIECEDDESAPQLIF